MVAAAGPDVDTALRSALGQPLRRLSEPKTAAEARMADDRMADPGNALGNAPIAVDIDGLLAQTRKIERAVAALSRGGI